MWAFVWMWMIGGTAQAQCTTDDACKGDRICEAGVCAWPPAPADGTCDTDAECSGDLVCDAGTCMSPGRPAPSRGRSAPEARVCPWDAIERVSASMTSVVINREHYAVTGRVNRQRFSTMLLDCGEDVAADRFRRWRASRRTTNALFGVGMFVPFVGWGMIAATPIPAANAGGQKNQMVASLAAR